MHRVLCFALLLLHCSGSKIKNDLRIPNVADLDTSQGSVGNIGNNALSTLGSLTNNLGNLGGLGLPLGTSGNNGNGQNTGQGISLGNIAGVLQTNIGSSDVGNIANIAQSSSSTTGNNGNGGEGGSGNDNNDQNDSILSVGNVAGVIQTNINVPTGNNDQNGNSRPENGDNNNSNDNNNGSGLNVGNIANIAQSNVQGGQGGIGNIAGIAQTNVNNIPGLLGNSQNGGLGNVNNILGLLGNSQNGGLGISDLAGLINLLNNNGQQNNNGGGIGNIANIAQSNIGGGGIGNIAGIAQSNINLNGNNNNLNEDSKFERPCQVFDIYCIRKYFAEHSICKESYGPTPDPMYRPQSTIFLSRINLTVTAVDVLYSGLNGRVEDFYINKETDRLVLAVEFRNMTFYAKDAYYRFHRRAREPVVTRDYLYFNYQSVLSTIIIPNTKDLQLEKSEVFAYTNDGLPTFSIGPNAFNNQDSTVQLARTQLVSDVLTTAQESQLTEAAFYTSTYLQYSICDFGLKIL